MVYTKKHPALFIIGVIMLALWYLGNAGLFEGLYEHLGAGKYKYAGEIATLPLYFGILSVVIGAWQWFGKHTEGHWDYYSSSVAGGMFILLIAMLVRWFLAPEVAVISTAMGKVSTSAADAREMGFLGSLTITRPFYF